MNKQDEVPLHDGKLFNLKKEGESSQRPQQGHPGGHWLSRVSRKDTSRGSRRREAQSSQIQRHRGARAAGDAGGDGSEC